MREVRDLRPGDWPEVARIFEEGIATGNATFEVEVPSWAAWDAAHLAEHRFVFERDGRIAGWVALSAVSSRCCYAGVAEISAYVTEDARGQGVGSELLAAVIESSERAGIWTLQTGVFPENEPSLGLLRAVRLPSARHPGANRPAARRLARRGPAGATKRGGDMTKVEAVVLRERVEIVIDAVEEQTGHVGVTVVEAVGHGRERGITHEYRGRVFESRFLPKALLTFVVADELAAAVAATVADAARSGNDSGDGLVWTTPVGHVLHHRTGLPVEKAA